ncbi:MAG: tRNA pseudouridine(38-40) synthase TruA [Clostridia bacterium]|nr:tRNA pseudouridine(38-40) synthase TruA [Clostridia bacterium]
MRNVVLCLSFLGTAFHGWQKQKNAETVSETLEKAIGTVTGEKTSVKGCGRTDSGVHALNYYCNFTLSSRISCEGLKNALNAVLPETVSVKKAAVADDGFHARFSAVSKEYRYRIYRGAVKDPFSVGRALWYKYPLDLEKLNAAAAVYEGEHDFSAFEASGSSVKDKIRTVYESEFYEDGDFIVYRVKGNGFLYNMVRIMVGTALKYNEGKMSIDDIKALFETGDRSAAGKTVAGYGLYLYDVYYGEELF